MRLLHKAQLAKLTKTMANIKNKKILKPENKIEDDSSSFLIHIQAFATIGLLLGVGCGALKGLVCESENTYHEHRTNQWNVAESALDACLAGVLYGIWYGTCFGLAGTFIGGMVGTAATFPKTSIGLAGGIFVKHQLRLNSHSTQDERNSDSQSKKNNSI